MKVVSNFLEWIHRGGLEALNIEKGYIFRLLELTKKFYDVWMDLTDASLIVASEITGIREIASIYSDSMCIPIFAIALCGIFFWKIGF